MLTKIPPPKIAIVSRDFEKYLTLCSGSELNTKVVFAGASLPEKYFNEVEVMLSEPDVAASIVEKLPNLKWLQSTWAGNNKLNHLQSPKFTVTGVKGIFGDLMCEYVMAYVLYFHRRIPQFLDSTKNCYWNQPNIQPLSSKTLGIMGMGNIGLSVAKTAKYFGMKVIGLTSNGENKEGVECYAQADLCKFTRKCDVIVNLLPETSETIGLCNSQFFEDTKKGALFINAGRGSIIDDTTTLVNALNNGQLSNAVLDVFVEEPLAPEHPLFNHEKIIVTNHTAAMSDPEKVFGVFTKNFQRYTKGHSLLYIHDFAKGY